jgi:uncharacterized protein involved in tolerance to divalent cations
MECDLCKDMGLTRPEWMLGSLPSPPFPARARAGPPGSSSPKRIPSALPVTPRMTSSRLPLGGVVRDITEARAFLRSRREQVGAIVHFVTDRHPYEVPNVTAVPIVDGNPSYLEWVRTATT